MQIQFEYLWLRPSLLSWTTLVCKYARFRAVAILDPVCLSLTTIRDLYQINKLILSVEECVQSVYGCTGIYILDDQSLV